jgi:iron complex outermembrane receptor protein
VPSLSYYSDSGVGTGYAYMYLRGIPQTRMNLTLDGVPLNEAEDSALYFVDFGDFASNVESVQVQRGVGISVPGAASFVGSVNFESIALKDRREISARLGGGSFGTARGTVAFHSGVVGGGLKVYGRTSWQNSDGFRDHSSVEQKSAFFGVSRQRERSFWKVFGFAGSERTGLAYLAVEADVLARDLEYNPLGPEERDAFGQRFLQGQYQRAVGASTHVSAQAYVNAAGGWYRLWGDADRTELLEYGLDWRMIGATTTVSHQRRNLTLTWGLHANDFRSRHEQDVVDGPHNYTNHGLKNEVSTYARIEADAGRWHHYADAQLRWTRFQYRGDLHLPAVSWTFLNPKLGTRYGIGPGLSAYASIGRAVREPTRSDLFAGEDNPTVSYDLSAVKPERVVDVEVGLDYRRTSVSAQANFYAMAFRNEIALTGELSEIGLPLRRNVDRSYRRGIELDLRWQPSTAVRLRHTSNTGWNRIAHWTQFYDVFDTSGEYLTSGSRVHAHVPPLLTPAYIGNLSAEWDVAAWLTLGGSGRYVSKSYLDNTEIDALRTPAWFNLDAQVSLELKRWFRAGAPQLRVFVTNVLDNRRLFPSGYSYQYITREFGRPDTLSGIPYYYPLATRSVFVALDLRM